MLRNLVRVCKMYGLGLSVAVVSALRDPHIILCNQSWSTVGRARMDWRRLLLAILLAFLVIGLMLFGWRLNDRRIDTQVWGHLRNFAENEGVYDPVMVKDLPEPARRYFNYTITEGAPLVRVVEIDMHGQLGLGDKAEPNYIAMKARQILAPPHGLVWALQSGSISGSDGATPKNSWTRFWLFNVVPVVRVGGDADHRLSAFGRVVAEGAFWAPASLLPKENVVWELLDENSARAIITYEDFRQSVDITVAANGQPTEVLIQRWSNANPQQEYRMQPFGGSLADFREFGGYRLPTRVEGGNMMGTDEYFPFYKVEVSDIRLITPEAIQ